MVALLKWLIGWPWCAHKWEILERINVYDGGKASRPYATRFVLQCEKCGDLKKREIGQ